MMGPLDLTKQPPRSAREELDGIAYLPRAIDKIRAEFPGGNLGQYVVLGNDGATVTGRFYRATGITHSELVDAVKSAPDDAGVAVWLHARLSAKTIADWNDSYYQTTIGHIKGPLRELCSSRTPAQKACPKRRCWPTCSMPTTSPCSPHAERFVASLWIGEVARRKKTAS